LKLSLSGFGPELEPFISNGTRTVPADSEYSADCTGDNLLGVRCFAAVRAGFETDLAYLPVLAEPAAEITAHRGD